MLRETWKPQVNDGRIPDRIPEQLCGAVSLTQLCKLPSVCLGDYEGVSTCCSGLLGE